MPLGLPQREDAGLPLWLRWFAGLLPPPELDSPDEVPSSAQDSAAANSQSGAGCFRNPFVAQTGSKELASLSCIKVLAPINLINIGQGLLAWPWGCGRYEECPHAWTELP
jgi:hypothetical protein